MRVPPTIDTARAAHDARDVLKVKESYLVHSGSDTWPETNGVIAIGLVELMRNLSTRPRSGRRLHCISAATCNLDCDRRNHSMDRTVSGVANCAYDEPVIRAESKSSPLARAGNTPPNQMHLESESDFRIVKATIDTERRERRILDYSLSISVGETVLMCAQRRVQ
jgi:hypothetical protein